MASFEKYILKQQCQKVAALGDKLSRVDELITWNPFKKIVSGVYDNTSSKGGRPNIDPTSSSSHWGSASLPHLSMCQSA